MKKSVYLEEIPIIDEYFTNDLLDSWKIFIASRAKEVSEELKNYLDPVNGIDYFISYSLLCEVIYDAVVGMRKMIHTTPHHIEHPNVFKTAAYLTYWFLRHKPISIYYPNDIDLDNIKLKNNSDLSDKEISWKLKHVNELAAVHIVTSMLFDFSKVVCNDKQCAVVAKANTVVKKTIDKKTIEEKRFNFKSFAELREIMINKLIYYFAYRAIAPKMIEHLLEAYAFHPAWGLTGDHWRTNE